MNEVTNNMETLREGSVAKDKRNETDVTLEDKTLVEVGAFAIFFNNIFYILYQIPTTN